MKFKFFLILLLIASFLFCGKSDEQKKLNREKALQLIKKADKHFFENNFEDALALYLQVAELDFTNPVLIYKTGFCYYKGKSDIKKAENYFLKALNGLKEKNNKSFLAATYFYLGYIALLKQEPEKKEEYFDISVAYLNELLAKGELGGENSFQLGYYYYDKNDYKSARKYFLAAGQKLKKENPYHYYYAAAYFNIGLTYWIEDKEINVNTTLYYWKKALNIEPDNKEYNRWYTKALEIKNAG